MQKFICTPRLTKDPEMRYTNDGKAIANLSFALARRYTQEGGPTADFLNGKAFGKTAEFFEKYGRKGVKFNIVGRIETGSYTNKEGQKVYTTDVIVEEVEFAESKASGQPQPQTSTQDSPEPMPSNGDGFVNIPDNIEEELPFN